MYIYIYILRSEFKLQTHNAQMHKYCCIYTLRGTSRTQLNIYDGGSRLLFSQKRSFIEFRLGSKYASDISLYISM